MNKITDLLIEKAMRDFEMAKEIVGALNSGENPIEILNTFEYWANKRGNEKAIERFTYDMILKYVRVSDLENLALELLEEELN